MAAPDSIKRLVENFGRNRETYKSGNYNETQVRVDFINPMFEALGWDVDNKKGYAEAYRDVIHEFSIKMGGTIKAPDYCFRIGQAPKFFLEAKKPAVPLKDAKEAALQLRRYAWSAKLPVSILTDFDEFAVYDCRVRPDKTDSSSVARTEFITFDKYEDKWDDIASIFGKEAILQGSFDKYVESKKKKRGTAEVDEAFLKEIEHWRELLAKNVNLRNQGLAPHELNEAVQKTIDRIIFLRICEDRGIEPYAQLMGLTSGDRVYDRLQVLFHRADDRYNSGLFHFRHEKERGSPDEWTLKLEIDDRPLKEILKKLYYPDSPYEFSVLPADILGQVYEQFLGKVITPRGRSVTIEDKPEVKKAGGVYYTPTYIVDYIVEHTVGKLLEGKSPDEVMGKGRAKDAHPLRVLDPACGSGTFLIGAYQKLLDWYLAQYIKEPEKYLKGKSPRIRETGRASTDATRPHDYRLTTSERKRILLDHIYGVDIDPQAVEVTKLSLLLKVLEGESDTTLNVNMQLFHERALPDLDSNIKCGNSLIGPDFYDDPENAALPEGDRRRINAFDWKAEFAGVFAIAGGFDAVIGNPPYIRVRVLKDVSPEQIAYLESDYACATHVWDIYLLFFERALQLLNPKGFCSYIVPIQTLHQPNCLSVRKLFLDTCDIVSICELSRIKVFDGAIVKNAIFVVRKTANPANEIEVSRPENATDLRREISRRWPQAKVFDNPNFSLKFELLSPIKLLCDKLINQSCRLGDVCYVTFGLRSCAKGVGQGGKDRLITDNSAAPFAKPYLEGRDIGRYQVNSPGRFIQYIPNEMYSPRKPALFESKKIVSQSMLSKMRLIATLDDAHHYVEQSLVCIIPHGILTEPSGLDAPSLEGILGCINSKLNSFFFASYVIDHSLGGGLIHATPGAQEQLLVPKSGKREIGMITEAVKNILSLKGRINGSKTIHDRSMIEREIERTDREIDRLVYELYGLTEAEIKIVEEATN